MRLLSCIFSLIVLSLQLSFSQNYTTGLYERIDTIITLDMETKTEEIKIVKRGSLFLDAAKCESLPNFFNAERCEASLDQLKKLSALEFRCNGLFQREWQGEWAIKSFNLVIYKAYHDTKTIVNEGSEFSEQIINSLDAVSTDEVVAFEQINLVHPKKGQATAGFTILLK